MPQPRVVNNGTTSDSDTSIESATSFLDAARPAAPLNVTKKRKGSYYARKDEIRTLQDQVKRLRAELQRCQQARVSPLELSLLHHASLLGHVESSHHTLAAMQSLTSASNLSMVQTSDGVVPLRDFIHLPLDVEHRNAVMHSLFDHKIQSARRFMAERTRFLDLRIEQSNCERFELADGTGGVVEMTNTPITTGHSLRQVYEALLFFIENREMSLTEKLGILTIRESEQKDESKFAQARFLSTITQSVAIEANLIMFTAFHEATESSPAYAIGAIDFVDEDDLYPFRSENCLRKELTGGISLTEIPSTSGGKPTISMARWSYVHIQRPREPVDEQAEMAVRESMVQWCDVTPSVMKEWLSTTPPAS